MIVLTRILVTRISIGVIIFEKVTLVLIILGAKILLSDLVIIIGIIK